MRFEVNKCSYPTLVSFHNHVSGKYCLIFKADSDLLFGSESIVSETSSSADILLGAANWEQNKTVCLKSITLCYINRISKLNKL